MSKMPKVRWQRLRKMIRERVSRQSLLSHQYALLDGIDHAANYINGYIAAGKGQARNDQSGSTMEASAVHLVWWQAGWDDYKADRPMNPKAFSPAIRPTHCKSRPPALTST